VVQEADGLSGHTGRAHISVALCTCNGARFLPAQLESILRQTRLPDEMQVFDDCSTDASVALVEEFAAKANFAVHIHRNARRQGSILNFEQAMRACTGSLIALCDQDDCWHPERLQRSEQALYEHPEAGAVFTDGILIDEDGLPTGVRLWERFVFTAEHQQRLRSGDWIPLAKHRFITGATLMFRAQYLRWIPPAKDGWHHDGWVSSIVGAFSSLCWLTEPLIRYRTHPGQQLGVEGHLVPDRNAATFAARSRNHWISFFFPLQQLDSLCATLDELALPAEKRAMGAAEAFYTHRAFLATRLGLPASRLRRIVPMLRARRSYRRCAMGWFSILKDFWMVKHGDELERARQGPPEAREI
jgi:glycosyltransferase involved in cell wall biosynthesis